MGGSICKNLEEDRKLILPQEPSEETQSSFEPSKENIYTLPQPPTTGSSPQTQQAFLANELVLFIISGYLSGEYVLRVIPLLCKATQSPRLSLCLLGLSTPKSINSRCHYYDLEGPIYGIHSKGQDLQRLFASHSFNALRLEKEGAFVSDSLSRATTFPSITRLALCDFKSFAFHRFPRLATLEISFGDWIKTKNLTEGILSAVWRLPLTALIMDLAELPLAAIHQYVKGESGPPAFAQTLRSLQTRSPDLLEILSPYCRDLQHLATSDTHEILAHNPELTSLSLSAARTALPLVDLTSQSRTLATLTLIGGHPVFSGQTQASLECVTLCKPELGFATTFLKQCPVLKSISLTCDSWQDMTPLISAIPNPDKCQLNVDLPVVKDKLSALPTLGSVEKFILHRGFRVNEEFLFKTRDAERHYEKIMELIPHIKTKWRILEGSEEMDTFITRPLFLESFSTLSQIVLHSKLPWNQTLMSALLQSCPVLKELKLVGEEFSGQFALTSQSLCKLNLSFDDSFTGFHLELPKLTHLSLTWQWGEQQFLAGLFNKDPLIHLPRLRALSILTTSLRFQEMMFVHSAAGHESLTRLELYGSRYSRRCKMNLQNLPLLRQLTIVGRAAVVEIGLDIPADCDMSLTYGRDSDSAYIRSGHPVSSTNFRKKLCFIDTTGWVEKDEHEKEKTGCNVS